MDNKTASVSTLRVVEELESPSSRKGGPPSPPFSDSERTESRDGNARLRFWENVRASPARPLLWSFAAYFVFTVLYCLFIHHVLIRGKPRVGVIMFDATTSNLLISIFSQFFVLLCDSVIFGLLDVMRTALASRDGGTSASAFFGISAATGWLSTFRLASVTGFRDLWCNFRLMIPVLGLLFGSVLKFKATFDYHFTPSDITKEVYAGLVPIDIRLLSNVRTADLWVYFQAFTSILLGHPRYSVPYHIDQCQTNCKSFLLPGGLEMARQYSPFLNQTLFNGGIFNTTEAIRIEASRGLALSFEHMGSGYEFDWAAECLYPDLPDGEQPDRVQLCVHQSTPSSVIAGWTSCPEAVWQNNSCATDPSWMRRPMPWTVKMTAYYQSATVTYDRDNGSIIDLRAIPHHPSTPPELIDVPLSAKDYLDLWRKILIPEPPKNTSTTRIELTRTKINSILYDITWLHRTYEVTFPDQKDAPLTYLSNFLAVPLQFGVVAVEFANYTVPKAVVDAFLDGKGFLLPEELRTVAVGGHSTTRLGITKWTGWVFIGGAIVMLVLAAVGIAWVLSRPVKGIGRSGIPELDILRVGGWNRSGEDAGRWEGGGQPLERRTTGLMTLPGGGLGLGREGNNSTSSWKLAAALKGWGVVSVNGVTPGGDTTFVAVQREKRRRKGGRGK